MRASASTKAARDLAICRRWLALTAGMVVSENHSASVELERLLNNDARINRCAVHRAGEQRLEADQLVLGIQEQGTEVLVLFLGKSKLNEARGIGRVGHDFFAGHVVEQDVGGDTNQFLRFEVAAHPVQALARS
jgi:hypothetical protein